MIALILVGKTLGVDLPFALAAICAAIVIVATLIPVSIGGIGIREGGFVLLLGEVGVDAADATLISLLSAAVVLLRAGRSSAPHTSTMFYERHGGTRAAPGRRSA